MKLQRATTFSLLTLLSLASITSLTAASACPEASEFINNQYSFQSALIPAEVCEIQLEPHKPHKEGEPCKFHHHGISCRESDHSHRLIQPKAAKLLALSGDKKVASHDFAGAISDYTLATQVDPTIGRIYTEKNHNFLVGSNLEQLIDDYNRVLQADPNNANALALRGEMKFNVGDSQGAEADFAKAIQLDNNLYFAHLRLNETNLFLQPENISTDDCRRALSQFPSDARLHLDMGLALGRTGYSKQAEFQYTIAHKLSPNWARPYYMLAIADLEKGNSSAAMNDLDQCIKFEPNWAWGYAVRAGQEAHKYDYKAAISDLDHAISIEPNASELVAYRAHLKLASGDLLGGMLDKIGMLMQRREFPMLLATWFILLQMRFITSGCESIRRRLLFNE